MTTNYAEIINANGSARVHNGNVYIVPQDNKDDECIKALRQTNPFHDKNAIIDLQGGLINDPAFKWILDHDHYKRWFNGGDGNVLWIRGDAGKGKTMMLCEIIENLKGKSAGCISYFFCQATNQKMNNATAVLRGLIYGLIRFENSDGKNQTVLSYVRKEFDVVGPVLFDGPNSWQAVSEIFKAILSDREMRETVLVVDALDECEDEDDRTKLLELIVQTSFDIPRVKWAVTSRKLFDIEDELCKIVSGKIVDLETEEPSVSKAVVVFINERLARLRWWKRSDTMFQQKIRAEMMEKSNNTFLWAALVCRELKRTIKMLATSEVLAQKALKKFPKGLVPLYERMMQLVSKRDPVEAKLCKEILAIVSTVYRPLSLGELASLVETLYGLREDIVSVKESVQMCGSFLTLRSETVFIVHQSVKDFFEGQAQAEIMPWGIAKQHNHIFARSLDALSPILKRNICGLEDPGSPVGNSSNHISLSSIKYACIHWVDHFEKALELGGTERKDNDIETFLRRHLLHWLEALSLLNSMSKAVVSVQKLESLLVSFHVPYVNIYIKTF
jgi:hypothetical protein